MKTVSLLSGALLLSFNLYADSNATEKGLTEAPDTNTDISSLNNEHKVDFSQIKSISVGNSKLAVITTDTKTTLQAGTPIYDRYSGQIGKLTGRLIVEANPEGMNKIQQRGQYEIVSSSPNTGIVVLQPKHHDLGKAAMDITELDGVMSVIAEKRINRHQPM